MEDEEVAESWEEAADSGVSYTTVVQNIQGCRTRFVFGSRTARGDPRHAGWRSDALIFIYFGLFFSSEKASLASWLSLAGLAVP